MTFLFRRFGGNLGIKFCLQGVKGNHLCHSCIALLMDYTQDAIVHLGCICNDMNQVIKIFRDIDHMGLLIIGDCNLAKRVLIDTVYT